MQGLIQGFGSQIEEEYRRARKKFGDFNSPHEGYGIILEELDELWELIKKNKGRTVAARKECIQLGAMIMAYYLELT